MKIFGPFHQVVTMDKLPPDGPLSDEQLQIIPYAGIAVDNGVITEIADFNSLSRETDVVEMSGIALPGFIDAHTHLCFAGNRAADYAKRLQGVSYSQIAAEGGGILDTVRKTRNASKDELIQLLLQRVNKLVAHGITTCEVKSGYGLTIQDEIKILETIAEVNNIHPIDLIPTCLAAHTIPWEFSSAQDYIDALITYLFPILKSKNLSNRIDIFVEEHAFPVDVARDYLLKAKAAGFQVCIHADQFTRGGSKLAAEIKALSADHLEETLPEDALAMKHANVIPIVLPGATLGLGQHFPPARMLLDHGLPLVIASDWNPGSAPFGDLLVEAAMLGAQQKLSTAETFAAITARASKALNINNLGILKQGSPADITVFPADDYREILYYQGSLKPHHTIKNGKKISLQG